jgi:glycosyltransferase involved in cell wall biosynthesis
MMGPLPPLRGGIAQFNSRLSLSVEEAGHRVARVGFRTLYPSLLFPGRSQFEPPSAASGPCAEILIRPSAPLTWPGARRAVTLTGCQACVVQWWHPFFAPCLEACTPRGIPAAVVCHNLEPHEGFPLGGALTRHYLAGKILAVHGETDVGRAQALGASEVVRLFHPIYDQYLPGAPSREEARAVLGFAPDRVVILFFGLVRRYKGLDLLVQAMGLLPENYVLLAAGENYGSERELERDAGGLGGRIIRHDRFIPDSEVGLYFRAADIVALPYRSATQSGVAQIALAFGKPLVATDVGSLREILDPGSTGELAPVPEPACLAEALSRCSGLLKDPELEERVRSFSRRFSWDVYTQKLLEALR